MSAARAALPRRWVHLLLGGALLMPFFLLVSVAIGIFFPSANSVTHPGWQLAAYAAALPVIAVSGLLPLVRTLESQAARALLELPEQALAAGPAAGWPARRRTAGWFLAHLGLGGLISGASLAIPPAAVVLVLFPFSDALRDDRATGPYEFLGHLRWLGLPAALVLLALLVAATHGAGALLARLAPALLGPTPADRLAAAEERAADLAARNRLARELHDSVGHALSTVTLQAAAAGRVLDADREFAREALAAIESTARAAVAELDTVLGLLREEDRADAAPTPTLGDLDGLLDRTRAAGLAVGLHGDRPPATLPALVSREAYRIVQEGLTNALRHAGQVPVELRFTTSDKELTLTMENTVTAPRRVFPGGGRGLTGIGERAALLGGEARWGAADGVWRLTVRLPLGASR
jgi:signal transduction histidine kinase